MFRGLNFSFWRVESFATQMKKRNCLLKFLGIKHFLILFVIKNVNFKKWRYKRERYFLFRKFLFLMCQINNKCLTQRTLGGLKPIPRKPDIIKLPVEYYSLLTTLMEDLRVSMNQIGLRVAKESIFFPYGLQVATR